MYDIKEVDEKFLSLGLTYSTYDVKSLPETSGIVTPFVFKQSHIVT